VQSGLVTSIVMKIVLYNKQSCLLGDHLMLLRHFGPYVMIIFVNVCVITVVMVILLRDFGLYGIIL
jgi:hypothetical protein